MRIEEAINQLKKDKEITVAARTAFNIPEEMMPTLQYDVAIEVLEKQVSVKPREHYNWCDFSEEEKKKNSQWFCSKCSRELGEENNYCSECGRKVNWE